jgi:hypothetical protein
VEGLRLMSETKDISKKRFSEFLAARLRAKQGNKPRHQPGSTKSRPAVGSRSVQTNSPGTEP